jgi:transcription elongation GreA/GreB family factor
MSVAFRRDSDEEHLEPKFELPIPSGPNLVTATGLALIDTRIADLDAALADTEKAADAERVTAIRRDLRYWHTRQTTAVLSTPPADGTIGFGSTVDFRLLGTSRTLSLVGDDEADPARGRIAFSAPLARALTGGEPGDVLPFNGRDDAIEIVAVR